MRKSDVFGYVMNLLGLVLCHKCPSKSYNENLIAPGKKSNPVRKWKEIQKSSNKQKWSEKENYRLVSVSSRNVLEIQEVYFALCEKFNSLRSHYEETITMMEMKYCYYGTNIFMINGKLALIIQ